MNAHEILNASDHETFHVEQTGPAVLQSTNPNDAAILEHLETPEMVDHIRRLYNRQVKYASPKSAFATIHQIPYGKSLVSTKPRKPAEMSGRQWKRARKALRKIAESGCQ